MKFKEMPYERPDAQAVKDELKELTARLKSAGDYEAAKEVFIAFDKIMRHIDTLSNLCHIRHTIDTTDTFYEDEQKFFNDFVPELAEYEDAWNETLLSTPFRTEFERDFGSIIFINMEIERKAFAPEIIGDMQEESALRLEYDKLVASAQIPFEGGTYTFSQLTPFKNDADDATRLKAWQADGAWYTEHKAELDGIYDRLVALRDGMAKKLGYKNYVELGYLRRMRNCYDASDVERFREAVRDHVVPLAEKIFKEKAERLGKSYPMNHADNSLEFRSGNPKPKGSAEDILNAGKRFYDDLSPETSKFFRRMLDDELLDVLSTKGKAAGGYMTELPDYGVPFIFANFNGTSGDVDVITHEAGHAFAGWLNIDRVPGSTVLPTLEGAEVHSMSMEFFGDLYAEDFFGEDARKYLYYHLTGAISFIPYGTMVDHFQHIVYENPGLTPDERHAEWKKLMAVYQPWMKLDGEIPVYGEGWGWQRQLHIYRYPFYYIDYCLAQTVALQFFTMIRKDRNAAWQTYMAYSSLGGSDTFTELLKKSGLRSPFDEGTLKEVCGEAAAYLESFGAVE